MRESTFYRYINGFVNIVKHRGIVKQNTQIDSKGFFGPIIEEFKYDENNFEKKRWTEAFENIQDLITEIVSCVGIINEEIKEYEENKECKT